MIADKQTSACAWARTTRRTKETVLLVHAYNRLGPEAVFFVIRKWTSPFFSPEQVKQLVNVKSDSRPPVMVGRKSCGAGSRGHGLRFERLQESRRLRWIEGAQESRPTETCRLLDASTKMNNSSPLYFHRDMDLLHPYVLQLTGWRLRFLRQCFIWNEGNCNKDHTIQFLQRMAEWLDDEPGAVVIIWDGATVRFRLPPMFHSHACKRMREEVTPTANMRHLFLQSLHHLVFNPKLRPYEKLFKLNLH